MVTLNQKQIILRGIPRIRKPGNKYIATYKTKKYTAVIEKKKYYMIKECPSCHSLFVDLSHHKYCKFCYQEYREKKDREQQEADNKKWCKQKEIDQAQFEKDIKSWNVVEMDSILPQVHSPLYIIGNGFDLLHGAKSSYYDFSNTLGKNNILRWRLETYLNAENLWGDFEEALGHLNVSMMASTNILDMWLDDYEAYGEDASLASFYMAAETAAEPVIDIVDDLQRRFRMWIESVAIHTSDRPLKSLIKNAPVLNFNYTEFIEDLYGVDHDNVCYIHGCRKKIKGKPKDKLILGHMPGANDSEYDFEDKWRPKNPHKRQMVEYAREVALEHIYQCDNELTKHCDEIIKAHHDFFDGLDITDVIVIGHSLSEVDWDYFREIIKNDDLNWYISCHGLRDLGNITRFVKEFGIASDKVHLFRLDGIKVKVDEMEETEKKEVAPKGRILCKSGKWTVKELKGKLGIYEGNSNCYSLIFPGYIRKAILFDSYLLVICDGVYFLKYDESGWKFIRELETIQNQSLINRRLVKLIYKDDELIFIYNNRIRKYRLTDGELIENKAMRNAREIEIPGESIRFN